MLLVVKVTGCESQGNMWSAEVTGLLAAVSLDSHLSAFLDANVLFVGLNSYLYLLHSLVGLVQFRHEEVR